jgi:general secretion pathway protein A
MYERFFGFSEPPFALTPDPRFLWLSETHEEGLSALVYGVMRRKGFILLTGEVGAGKTTLLRAALHRLEANPADAPETAMVLHTADLTGRDLLKLIAAELGLPSADPAQRSTADYVIELQSFLIARLRSGLNTVIIVDEAQNLGAMALEQLRLLSNLESDSEKLLQIVLTGQPELRRKLADPQLRALRQRIAISHHVESLRPDEVASYLHHRVRVAGGVPERVFEPGVEEIVAAFSGGCPRLINLLADRSLLAAYAKKLARVPRALVDVKAKEMEDLRWDLADSFAERP